MEKKDFVGAILEEVVNLGKRARLLSDAECIIDVDVFVRDKIGISATEAELFKLMASFVMETLNGFVQKCTDQYDDWVAGIWLRVLNKKKDAINQISEQGYCDLRDIYLVIRREDEEKMVADESLFPDEKKQIFGFGE